MALSQRASDLLHVLWPVLISTPSTHLAVGRRGMKSTSPRITLRPVSVMVNAACITLDVNSAVSSVRLARIAVFIQSIKKLFQSTSMPEWKEPSRASV
jgi:hypothetical protein